MGPDILAVLVDAVLQQVRNADATMSEESFLVSLPAYLDATEVQRLQTEINQWSVVFIALQHRPGERRIGVRLRRSRRR